jgi:hypothetical protein
MMKEIMLASACVAAGFLWIAGVAVLALAQETRKTGEQAAQTARVMSDAAERTSRTGAETFRRNADVTREAWQAGTEAAGRIAQRSMEQLTKMIGFGGDTARETLQHSAGNMQAVLESTTIIAGGLQGVTSELMRFAESRAEQNMAHLDRLGQCRNLHELFAQQTQMVRDNFEAFLQSAQRASERTTEMTRSAMDRMSNAPTAPR